MNLSRIKKALDQGLSYDELAEIMISELGNTVKELTAISKPAQVAPALIKKIGSKRQEHFAVVTLSGAHEVINIHVVTKGLLNRTLAHPREVFFPAIKDGAASIIISHNHPSSNTSPSADDFSLSDRMKKAGEILGIPVLDHIIVTKNGFHSMVNQGQF